jgi:hypothetical protein
MAVVGTLKSLSQEVQTPSTGVCLIHLTTRKFRFCNERFLTRRDVTAFQINDGDLYISCNETDKQTAVIQAAMGRS